MGDQRDQDEGFEGDVSDKAGDRLGGGASTPPDVELDPEDLPIAPPPQR